VGMGRSSLRCEFDNIYIADFRFFMNLMKLKKGEGIYVGADGPHAWLTGGEPYVSPRLLR